MMAFNPAKFLQLEAAMKDQPLQALLARAGRAPNWMPDPETWLWFSPAGVQGFGSTWKDNPGLANLLWLVMDCGAPPGVYDARTNQNYVHLVAGASHNLAPVCLLAEALDLADFSVQFQDRKFADAHALYPRLSQALVSFARRRLNANPQ